MARQRIAVLGAGPMGLAVAYQLARDGHRPIVFEADDRVGGMTATFDFGGLDIERYYHFHCTSDTAFFQVLDELKLADKMRWVSTKMGYYYQDKVVPWGNPVALLMVALLAGLQAVFTYVPAVQAVFQSAPLVASSWGVALGLGGVLFGVIEVEKAVWRRRQTQQS